MLVSVYTYRCILPANISLPHLKFYLISIAHAAKNTKEIIIHTFLLVFIALGVIAKKGNLLLPEIYGLNCLFICKRSSQENFFHGHFSKLLFLLSFLNSELLSWGLSMELCCSLPETPLGWVVKQGIWTWKNLFRVGLFYVLHSLARCCVTSLFYISFFHFMVSASSVSAAALSGSGCRDALLGKGHS